MAKSSRRCHCSAPYCSNNKQIHPYLSFHDFAMDDGFHQGLPGITGEEAIVND